MVQPNPYTRHIKPKKPEGKLMRLWGYVGSAIVWVMFGVGAIFWNAASRDALGRRKRGLRHLDDL